MTNITSLEQSQAITNTVVGTTPVQQFVPSIGSITTDVTNTFGEGSTAIGGPATTNYLITITDDVLTKYDT